MFQGCDASVLLNTSSSTNEEKDSLPNQTLHGIDVIDLAKSKLEKVCAGKVSCADIIALATRDAVALVCMLYPFNLKCFERFIYPSDQMTQASKHVAPFHAANKPSTCALEALEMAFRSRCPGEERELCICAFKVAISIIY